METNGTKGNETAVVVRQPEAAVALRGEEFLPVMDMQVALQRRRMVVEFTKSIMEEGQDFGTIPGTQKPTLLKPGAEKLQSFFGLEPGVEPVREVLDWTGEQHGGEPFFFFEYRFTLSRNGRVIGVGVGSANSWESKYRYRWVPEEAVPADLDKTSLRKRDGSISEFAFAVDKAETAGPYGKPAEYWQRFKDAIAAGLAQKTKKTTKTGKELDAWEIGSVEYRIPNPDSPDVVNTVQKMAYKRAQVAATLNGTGASELMTQDLEDLPMHYSTGETRDEIVERRKAEITQNPPRGGSQPHRGEGGGHSSDAAPAPSGGRPEPVPATDDSPDAVFARLVARLKTKSDWIEAFTLAKGAIVKAMGTDAKVAEIFARHEIKSPSDVGGKKGKQLKDCLRELWDFANALNEQTQPAEAEFISGDDDIPAELGGTWKEPESLFDESAERDGEVRS